MPATATVPGIRALANRKKTLTVNRLESIRTRLRKAVRWPKLECDAPRRVRAGETLEVSTDVLRLPRLDYYEGRAVPTRSDPKGHPILATFNGPRHRISVPVRVNRRKRTLRMDVPQGAIDGAVLLLFPLRERYGPTPRLRKIDRKNVLGRHVGVWNAEATAACDCGKKVEIPDDLCDRASELSRYVDAVGYEEVLVDFFCVQCAFCSVDCPHDAIEFDENGDCYVNYERCVGKTHHVVYGDTYLDDGWPLYTRHDEEACFECGAGTSSSQCAQDRLRKVLHHNGVCCGFCHGRSKVQRRDLMQLCDYGAVTVEPGSYVVDKALCVGCEACYVGINCHLSVDDNRTLKMVAHLDPPAEDTPPCEVAVLAPCGSPLDSSIGCIFPVVRLPDTHRIVERCRYGIVGPCRPEIIAACSRTVMDPCRARLSGGTTLGPGEIRTYLERRWKTDDLQGFVRGASDRSLAGRIARLPKTVRKQVRMLVRSIRASSPS